MRREAAPGAGKPVRYARTREGAQRRRSVRWAAGAGRGQGRLQLSGGAGGAWTASQRLSCAVLKRSHARRRAHWGRVTCAPRLCTSAPSAQHLRDAVWPGASAAKRVRVLLGQPLDAASLAGHLGQTPLQAWAAARAEQSTAQHACRTVRTSCRPLVGIPVRVATRLHTWPLQARTSCAAGARTARPAWWQPELPAAARRTQARPCHRCCVHNQAALSVRPSQAAPNPGMRRLLLCARWL
jgi:hypothetical protein